MSDSLGIPTTDCSYFDYLRIEKSQRRGKALQKLQRRLDKPLLQTTSYIHQLDQKQARSTHERAMIAERLGATHDLPELDVVLADLMEGEQADLRHLRLSVLVCCGEDSLATFLKQTIALFDAELNSEDSRGVICGEVLQTHLFLSAKVGDAVRLYFVFKHSIASPFTSIVRGSILIGIVLGPGSLGHLP